MIKVPEHIKQLKSYKAGISAGELKKKYGLNKVARLDSNENTAQASPRAIQAMKQATADARWYPDGACTEIRRKISEHIGVDTKNVVVGNGSESVLSYIFNAFFNPGDELLTSNGTFVATYIWAAANNIKVWKTALTQNYSFDLVSIFQNITSSVKAIYLANPNNPTGSMFTESEFMAVMNRVPDDILIIVDEAYHEYALKLSDEYPNTALMNFPNVITLRTFSKAYGLAGVRIGYGIADEILIESLMKMKLTFEPSVIAQAAGIGALDDQEFVDRVVQRNKIELQKYYQLFDDLELNYPKSYGNFVMIDLGMEQNVQHVHQQLLKRGVMTRPLAAYGLPKGLRVTVGRPWENEMFFRAFMEVHDLLKEGLKRST